MEPSLFRYELVMGQKDISWYMWPKQIRGFAMHKAILIMLLAVVSSSAMAEWVKVSEDKLVTAYADPTTIRKLGDKVKMWALWDYSTAQEDDSKPHMSTRVQKEFNCITLGHIARKSGCIDLSVSLFFAIVFILYPNRHIRL